MNAYPADYRSNNLPLVLLSGLEDEKQGTAGDSDKTRAYLGDGGFRIHADVPPVRSQFGQDLRAALLECDCSDRPWHSPKSDLAGPRYAFKIRSVARNYTFPPRKAPPPAHSPRLAPTRGGTSPAPLVLHSPLSPLSPSSPLFPDGIVTPWWITKHQHRLPSVLVSFYTVIGDSNSSSLEDNKIKAEVNSIRTLLTSTNYKTKFVLVLVGEHGIDPTDLEERLINIRRGTNFDSKALYYLPSSSSAAELRDFARVLFQTLYPASIEYYRDLSKHARRKRNRSSIPQPTVPPTQGSSSVLSLQGWTTRYEFKLGVFAEFRQEMEAACRNYEASYDALFGPELLGSIPTRSYRFNEARLLSDVIAIRIIRCLLWSSQTTLACRWWGKHQARVQDLVNRRGTGTDNYAWEAWQTIWCNTMADLVHKSAVFDFSRDAADSPSRPLAVQLQEERAIPQGERPFPWESLHHEGYWLRKALSHIRQRRKYALEIPEEERQAPNHNESTKQPSRNSSHRPYLAPEPWKETSVDGNLEYDYDKDYRDTLEATVNAFEARQQEKEIATLHLNHALELVSNANYAEALEALTSVNQKAQWRVNGWWDLVRLSTKALSNATDQFAAPELGLIAHWELAFLVGLEHDTSIPKFGQHCTAAVDLSHHLSPVTCTFAFASDTGHVGERTQVQLAISSVARTDLRDLRVLEIKVVFEGGIKPLVLTNTTKEESSDNASLRMDDLILSDSAAGTAKKCLSAGTVDYSGAEVDLAINHGQSHVFNFTVTPKDAGPASVSSITILFGNDECELTTTDAEPLSIPIMWWERRKGKPVPRLLGKERHPTTINVLPKPPKVELTLPDLSPVYYTNEEISLTIQIANNEDETVEPRLEVRLISPRRDSTTIQWAHMQEAASVSEGEAKEIIQNLPACEVGKVAPAAKVSQVILISGLLDSVDHELEIFVTYGLPSHSETTLRQSLAADLAIVRPFEVNTAFHPRVADDPWPDFFQYSAERAAGTEPTGLKQHFYVLADVASFASESLQIRNIAMIPRRILGDADAVFSEPSLRLSSSESRLVKELVGGIDVLPESIHQFGFDLSLEKLVLGDRQPVAGDFLVSIQWSRTKSEQVNTSLLSLPKFLTPMSEPRVLLESRAPDSVGGYYELVYTLENPSMHFLTFGVTMDGGEQLAFSGPKSSSLSLVPISRTWLRYRILPIVKNDWVRVNIEVNDAYFGQVLKVQPASDGVRVDKQGHVQIWVEG